MKRESKIIFVKLFFIAVVIFGTTLLHAAQEIELEPLADQFKRFRHECYIDEWADRQKYKKCIMMHEQVTSKLNEDQLANWKHEMDKILEKDIKARAFWDTNCHDYDPVRPRAFRPSDPISCVPMGEIMEEKKQAAPAKLAYEKACGIVVTPADLKDEKKREVAMERLNLFGCVTKQEKARYKLTGDPEICTVGRLTGCVRLAAMLELEEKKGDAKQLYKRACEGGVDIGCERASAVDEESGLLTYAAVGLIGLSIFIVMNMLFQDESQYKAASSLEDGEEQPEEQNHGAILKWSKPLFRRYVSPIVSSMKGKKKIKEKYRRPLAAAGLQDYLTTEDFYSFKIFLIVGFPIAFMVIRWFLEEDWPLKLIPVIGAAGFIYPDIWIKGKIEDRQQGVMGAMPFAVDMLALSVEAGLDFIAAMQKVIEKARPSPLVDEFKQIVKEIKIGASRAEALRNMAWRVDRIEISSFTATLIAADSVGASIGPILKNLSKEIRQKKSSEVEKKGATAATKILFPMLFLIVPAVFIVVGGPIVLQMITGN